jgi:hypothetical protein
MTVPDLTGNSLKQNVPDFGLFQCSDAYDRTSKISAIRNLLSCCKEHQSFAAAWYDHFSLFEKVFSYLAYRHSLFLKQYWRYLTFHISSHYSRMRSLVTALLSVLACVNAFSLKSMSLTQPALRATRTSLIMVRKHSATNFCSTEMQVAAKWSYINFRT